MSTEPIQTALLALVDLQEQSLTPAEAEKHLARQLAVDRRTVRSALRDMVNRGELSYASRFGQTVVQRSFDRPVRVSRHVVLKPPDKSYAPAPGEVVISLCHGVSFGTGQHPTTRLALRGLEHAVHEAGAETGGDTTALDIGTGSGVLAIAAVRFGIAGAAGTDLDPCAVSEARENVRANGLEDRISISDADLDMFTRPFTLITANLRFPTLSRMYPDMVRLTRSGSGLILSGIRPDEVPELLDTYTRRQFTLQWQLTEKGWAGLFLVRR